MTKRNDGGPAFPVSSCEGISTRTWLVGQILAGGGAELILNTFTRQGHDPASKKFWIETVYAVADAMLEEDEK